MKTLNNYINEWRANTNTVSSIKKQYFIYELTTNKKIKIFDKEWPQLNDYIDKVYINGEHISILENGFTNKIFKPSIYEVEIKDIDNVTNCQYMFCGCSGLTKIPLYNTSNVENMDSMFAFCTNIKDVPLFNTKNVKTMKDMFYMCGNLSEKTIQEWSTVYDFKNDNKKQ